ncbi:hypothetical protein M8494_10340 [Serratia ureilytica]
MAVAAASSVQPPQCRRAGRAGRRACPQRSSAALAAGFPIRRKGAECLGHFAKQRRQCVDGGGSAAFQLCVAASTLRNSALGAQSVEFAGAGAHLFYQHQTFTLAVANFGDHLKFGV